MSFFELFQPGLRFLREEKDRQKMLVAEPKYGRGGGPLGIDLDSGTATFTMPPRNENADAVENHADPEEDATAGTAVVETEAADARSDQP